MCEVGIDQSLRRCGAELPIIKSTIGGGMSRAVRVPNYKFGA